MNIIKLFLDLIIGEGKNSNAESNNNELVTRNEEGNVIKREYPNGLKITYRYDILNRERELRTSEGYVEVTSYHNTSSKKKQVSYYYKRQRWVDLISLDGHVETYYVDEEGNPIK